MSLEVIEIAGSSDTWNTILAICHPIAVLDLKHFSFNRHNIATQHQRCTRMLKKWVCRSSRAAEDLIEEALPLNPRADPDGSRGRTFELNQPSVDTRFAEEIRELCGGAPISHVNFALISPKSRLKLRLFLQHSPKNASRTFLCVLRGSGATFTAAGDPTVAPLVVDPLSCVPFDMGDYRGEVVLTPSPGVYCVFQTTPFAKGALCLQPCDDDASDAEATAEDEAFARRVRMRRAMANAGRVGQDSSVVTQWARNRSFLKSK